PFPAGEDEIDLGLPLLEPVDDREQPVETRDADVVRPNDPNPELEQDGPRLLRQHHVARAAGQDRHYPSAVARTERADEPNDPVVGEELQTRPGPGSGTPGPQRTELSGRGSRDERPELAIGERFEDAEQLVHALALPENDLGNSDPTSAVPVQPCEMANPERPRVPAQAGARPLRRHAEDHPSRDIADSA